MSALLPIVSMTDLQRHTKRVLEELQDFAVIRSHGRDRGLLLSPALADALLHSGLLLQLREAARKPGTRRKGHAHAWLEASHQATDSSELPASTGEPAPVPSTNSTAATRTDALIGNVLLELSKR